jgi:Zn-dependent protease with chaperone function
LTVIRGHYYDGRSARRQAATLAVQGGVVRISTDDVVIREGVPLDVLQVSSRLGNTPRVLRFADDGLFETDDNDAVDRVMARLGAMQGLVHRLESSLRYVAVALVVTVLFIWAGVRYGVPAVAEVVAHSLPAEVSRSLDQGAMEVLDGYLFRTSTLPVAEQERLRTLFAPLVAEAAPAFRVQVLFRDAERTIGANALALPSGTVVFTDQLVRLARHDGELQAILAHEIGHVVHRHGLRQTLQGSMLTLGAVVVLGDVSSVSSLMVGLPVMLTELGYSRAFEREADAYGVQAMARHGIDPGHFAAILARLEQAGRCPEDQQDCMPETEDHWEGYLSTHPPTAERLQRIEALSGG